MRSIKLMLAAVLALLAMGVVGASCASALESEWAIEGEGLAELKLKEEKTGGGGAISISVPGLGTTVKCLESSESGKALEGGSAEIVASLTKCEVVKLTACKVTEPVTMEAKAVLIEAGGYFYAKLEALKAEKPLMTVFVKGKECSLAEENKVTGKVAATVSTEETKEQPLVFSEATSKKVNEGLKAEGEAELSLSFGKQAASLSGQLLLSLKGANVGKEFMLAPRTKLCKEAPMANDRCPATKNYAAGTTLTFTNNAEFKFVFEALEPACKIGFLKGTTSAAIGSPMLNGSLSTVEFEECGGGCSAKALKMPWKVQFDATGAGDGNLILRRAFFKLFCGGKTCVYSGHFLSFAIFGATPSANFNSPPQPLIKEEEGSEPTCPGFALWEGVIAVGGELTFNVAAPAPMWVTS
jgi:hypothetical protein